MGINPMSPKNDRTLAKQRNRKYTDMFVQACRDVDYRAFTTAIKKGADLTVEKYTILGELDPHGHPQSFEFTLKDLVTEVCSKLSNSNNDKNAQNILMDLIKLAELDAETQNIVISEAFKNKCWKLAKTYLNQNNHDHIETTIRTYEAAFDVQARLKNSPQNTSNNNEWIDFLKWVEETYCDQFPDHLKLKIAIADLKSGKPDKLSKVLDSDIEILSDKLEEILTITSSANNLSPDFKLNFLQYYIRQNHEEDNVITVISNIKEPRLLSKIFNNCDFSDTTKNTLLNQAINHNNKALANVLLKQPFKIEDSTSTLNRALLAECDSEILISLLEKGAKLNFSSLKTIVSEDMIDELELCLSYQELPKIRSFDINTLFDETRHHIAPQCFLFLATHYGLASLDGSALESHYQFFIQNDLSTSQRKILSQIVEEEHARRELKSLFFGAALQIQYSQSYTNNIEQLNDYFGDIFNHLAKTRKSSINEQEHQDLKQHINNFKNQ